MASAAVASQSLASFSSFAVQLKGTPNSRSASLRLSPVQRRLSVRSEAPVEDATQKVANVATSATPIPTATPAAPKAVKPKAPTNFGDVFAFSGPAPETINGRLAMVGFVTALLVEGSTGTSLAAQLGDTSCFSWALFAASLFTAASLVPMFQGVSAESKSGGVFNVRAERWNGRAAMVGLVALAITEAVKGSTFLQ
eukprot:jgi/Mesen1/8277/ME000045S07733